MPNEEGLFTQEEVDAAQAEIVSARDAAVKDAEDARLEVFTEDYANFLKTKESKTDASSPPPDASKAPDGKHAIDW